VVEEEPSTVIAKKVESEQPETAAKPRGRGRARQLVAVKLTQFEWGVVLAALEIARTSADERSWLSTLEYELGVLTDDIAGQLGIPSETGAAVAMAPASNGGQA